MAITGTIKLTGELVGLSSGRKELEVTWAITAGVEKQDVVTLAAGDNTITIPTGATMCLIAPPSGNSNVITLKGAGGDTGHPLHKTAVTPLTFDTGDASFILNASAEITGVGLTFL